MGSQVRVDDVDVVDPGRASPMEKFPLGFRASLLGFFPTAGRLSSPMVTWYINCSILHHLRGNMRDIFTVFANNFSTFERFRQSHG